MEMPPTNPLSTSQEPQSTNSSSVIKALFHSILVETVKDFFGSILGFFGRYLRHYQYCLKYLWQPTLRKGAIKELDWKENSQQSFELSLLFLFALIFMVKLGWIPPASAEVMDLLSNDLSQMGIELLLFVLFAITYVVAAMLSIFVGRLLRVLFEMPMNRNESDILLTYLNNVVISVVLVLSFLFRCSFSTFSLGEDEQDTFVGIWVVLFLLLMPLLLVWAIRFCKTNGMDTAKNVLFTIITFFPLVFFYSLCGYFLTSLFFNI